MSDARSKEQAKKESVSKKFGFAVLKRLFPYVKPYQTLFIGALFFTISLAFLVPYRTNLIGFMTKEYIEKKTNLEMLGYYSMIIISLLILESLLQILGSWSSNLLAQSIIRDVRGKVFRHILTFKMSYFDKTPIGSLVTRVVQDLEAISQVFSAGFIDIFGDLLSLTVILIFMFVADWQLTLLALLPIPLLIIATRIFARAMNKSFQSERTQVNRLNNFVQERITGMSIVQLFNRQKQEQASFEEINKAHRKAHIDAVWAFSIFFPVVELLASLSIAWLLIWGVFEVAGKNKGPDVFSNILLFTLYINLLYRPIRMMADKFNILQRGVVRAERIFEVIDEVDEVQKNGTISEIDFSKDIVFNKVAFSYVKDQPVLKAIDLHIQSGTTVAFVGATGAGKTSLVNLLSRFYDYESGKITIGEHDIQTLELSYLRNNIAVVLQDVFLFSDSILNNITLGDPSITKEQVVAAAKAIDAHDFIMRLPGNYDYNVGERGGVLSVGQRQLLSFIRAYVYDPKILILDEATSSIDSESEALIQKAVQELTKGRTSIVIAHRLSTIQNADKIVVLDHGNKMEEGSHAQLMEHNGLYKRLHEKQFQEI
jgi:ATP-binding cassette, subfamily B, multidrug efflux pump